MDATRVPGRVYVDDMFLVASVPYRGGQVRGRWCHLFAHPDDAAALHAFASRIGMSRSWFQRSRTRPGVADHYDVTESRRTAALDAGAVAVATTDGARLRRAWAAELAARTATAR